MFHKFFVWLENLLKGLEAVLSVEDGEARVEADRTAILSEQAHAQAVECAE